MLLPQLELDLEAARLCPAKDKRRLFVEVGEALTSLDTGEPEIRTEFQIRLQPTLRHRDLERSSAGHGGNRMFLGDRDLLPRGTLVGDDPACHGDLEDLHQVRALLEVTGQSDRVVSGVEGTGSRGHVGYTQSQQEIVGMQIVAPIHHVIHSLDVSEFAQSLNHLFGFLLAQLLYRVGSAIGNRGWASVVTRHP